jgi:hypothetical protein
VHDVTGARLEREAWRSAWVAPIVLCMLICRPSQVLACLSCRYIPAPAAFTRPEPDEPTLASLRRQQVFLRCDPAHDGIVCSLRARYAVLNPSHDAERLGLSLGTQSVSALTISLDGKTIATQESDANEEIYGRLGPAARAEREGAGFNVGGRLVRFEATLAPGRISEIVVEGTVEPTLRTSIVSKDRLPMRMRHPFFFPIVTEGWLFDQGLEYHYAAIYPIEPKGRWATVALPELSVDYPADWDTELRFVSRPAPPRPAVWYDSLAPAGRKRISLQCVEEGAGSAALVVHTPETSSLASEGWIWGGPVLGLGADATSPAGFRTRLGYETAYPQWLIYWLTFDTDYRTRMTVAPGLELASSGLEGTALSAALGFGVPVRWFSHAAVGLRSQASVLLHWVGLVASVDLYPSQWHARDGDRVDALLLGRISL